MYGKTLFLRYDVVIFLAVLLAASLIGTTPLWADDFTEVGIGTTTIPHGGVGGCLLALDGDDRAGIDSPHIQVTTDEDNYPALGIYTYYHDNACLSIDTYLDNTGHKSSYSGSNMHLVKYNNEFKLGYDSGKAPGTSVNLNSNTAWNVDLTNGEIQFPQAWGDQVTNYPRDLYIDYTGKIGYMSSSIRFKQNVRDAGEADTAWIHELRPVMFDYKDSVMGESQCGLIAEEVELVRPEIVSYERVMTYPEEKGGEGHAGGDPIITFTDRPETVEYSRLVVPLLAEVQRLKLQVESLQDRIALLQPKQK